MAVQLGKPTNEWYAENFQRPVMGSDGKPKPIAKSSLRATPRGYSQSDVIQHRVTPGMSSVTDPSTGSRLNIDEAMDLGPLTHGGFNTRMGRDDGRRIGSASGAVGSGGTPTSQRGRAERVLQSGGTIEEAADAAMTPSWVMSEQARQDGGLSQSQNYGGMGQLPLRTRPTGAIKPDASSWFSPTNTSPGNIKFFAEGTKDSGPKPQVAVVGEQGPETVILPPRSAVIPAGIRMPSDIVNTAIDELDPPKDGDIRVDAKGNEWRYDAKQGRGIPLNPYLYGNENTPSPNAFRASPSERYNDLTSRLNALRQAGMAEGRAAVERVKAEQNAETARREAFLATGKAIPESQGGGTGFITPHGVAIVNGNRPKSFTVENLEGGQATTSDLAEAERESRADAAERRGRDKSVLADGRPALGVGQSLEGYRASPNAVPTALEEIVGVAEEVPEVAPAETAKSFENDPDLPSLARRRAFSRFTNPSRTPQSAETPAVSSNRPVVVPQSRVGQAASTAMNRLRSIPRGISDTAGGIWDYLFTSGGTERERQAQSDVARIPQVEASLRRKGFKIEKDENGNWKSITR